VAAGDRVAVEVFQSCRARSACRAGEYRRCARHGLADVYGFLSVDREPGLCLGLCAAAAAKEAGAGFVMVTGLGARDADRLALASRFGADLAVDVSADDPVVELTKATGTLADAVVNVTALVPAAIALARPAGTVVPRRCVGLDDAEDLLATMAGERDDVPPVHGVLTP
jgi:threonine dehydrogenase-like Zn-dependent dehydrogenase